jgi:hypothetical protein
MPIHRVVLAIVIALVCAVRGTGTDRHQSVGSHPTSVPARDSTGQATGTATITGTVVTLSSGEPITDASVTLYASTFAGGRTSMTTDGQGRFQFSRLAAGRYTVGAVKAGFVNVVFGERLYGRGGRAIPLRDGEYRDIRLQLPHPSVITGRTVDENGRPAVGAFVRAVRFSMAAGYRRAVPGGSANTDSRGVFRIPSLNPGEYAVCASTQATAPLNDSQRIRMEIDRERRGAAYVLGPGGVEAQKRVAPRLAELEAHLPPFVPPVRGYAPVCYPTSASSPTRITLAPDEERSGVDMRFALTRLARVEGRVTGTPPDNRDLDLIWLVSADDVRDPVPYATRPDFDGRFSFTNIPPGRYDLFVHSAVNGPSHSPRIGAATEVVVADEDISTVVLNLQPGVTVSGHVVFRGARPESAADVITRGDLQIRLDRAVPGPLARWPRLSSTRPDASGQFVLHDVFPGEYRVTASQREQTGWFEDTTMIPGADVTGQLLEVNRQNITGVTVTLTDWRGAEISGTITTDKGEPAPEYFILVYPTDEKYWTPYSYRLYGTRANQDGEFTIGHLRAGSYRLATILDAEFGAWFDPAFLRRIDADSMALSIASDEKKVLNLRVPSDR